MYENIFGKITTLYRKDRYEKIKFLGLKGSYLRHNNHFELEVISSEYPDNQYYKEFKSGNREYEIVFYDDNVWETKFNVSLINTLSRDDILKSIPLSSSQIIYDLKTKETFKSELYNKTIIDKFVTTAHNTLHGDEFTLQLKNLKNKESFYLDPIFWKLIPNLSETIPPYPERLRKALK